MLYDINVRVFILSRRSFFSGNGDFALKAENEFLRKRPSQRNNKVLYDLSNLIIPVLFAVIGIVVSVQVFAEQVGYDPFYTGDPVFVTKSKFFFIEEGYPFYNPGYVYLMIFSKPFDGVISDAVGKTLFYLLSGAGLAVLSFFVISAIRGRGLNKNDSFYGTARWGNDKDMVKAGLVEKAGVVLAQLQKADVRASVNHKSGSLILEMKKMAKLICASSDTNFLMLAPTRSGKGVGSIIPTLLYYLYSMIVFDTKAELWEATSGFRSKFSHVLKFSPTDPNKNTVRFNPLEEVRIDTNIITDINLIVGNFFEAEKAGGDSSNAEFFNNNAKDMLKAVMLHVLTAEGDEYAERRNISGVLHILSAANESDDDEDEEEEEEKKSLWDEIISTKHTLNGVEAPWLEEAIYDVANRLGKMNPKVRKDVSSTVFSKLNLFDNPNIAYATNHSDFKLSDFAESDNPITLYLCVPFAQIDIIAPVFRLLINFMLRKFSDGETSFGEVKLKNKILFLLDEFPVLGRMDFLAKCMGILAGFGINFYLVCQGLNQLIDIYGQNQPFLTHCKTQIIYAPGKVEDAKVYTEAMGKESVMKESLSVSGSRYAVALNNLNASSQEIARDLMNPDELMKLPRSEALIINQNDPPYIAKKCVYYNDPRFKYNAYSVRKTREYMHWKWFWKPAFRCWNPFGKDFTVMVPYFARDMYKSGKKNKDGKAIWHYRVSGNLKKGIPVPFSKFERVVQTGFEPPTQREKLELELRGLPSWKELSKRPNPSPVKKQEKKLDLEKENSDDKFNVFDYLATYDDIDEKDVLSAEFAEQDDGVPPTTCRIDSQIFSEMKRRQNEDE